VSYKNQQWAVTNIGLESLAPAPTYQIDAARLVETSAHGTEFFYDWPIHMAEKTWVDIEAFVESFKHALRSHADKCSHHVNLVMLASSVAEARSIAERRSTRGS
jgi:hypothetical protein